MEDIICVTCDDSFPINNETSTRMAFEQEPWLRHLHSICPYCNQEYKLFMDTESDKLIASWGIGIRWTAKPAPDELKEMFNRQFYPDVDEDIVSEFMDQVEAYSRS